MRYIPSLGEILRNSPLFPRSPCWQSTTFSQTNCHNCAVWISRTVSSELYLYIARKCRVAPTAGALRLGTNNWITHMINKPRHKLRKRPQPPLSHPGAIPDSDRAKKPPLGESRATNQELEPGDRVERLGDFGKPNGELGTVERTNEDDAVVKWDDDGRVRLHQPSLKKV
jgi:hypothetical protein